jgi:hypothetical protein
MFPNRNSAGASGGSPQEGVGIRRGFICLELPRQIEMRRSAATHQCSAQSVTLHGDRGRPRETVLGVIKLSRETIGGVSSELGGLRNTCRCCCAYGIHGEPVARLAEESSPASRSFAVPGWKNDRAGSVPGAFEACLLPNGRGRRGKNAHSDEKRTRAGPLGSWALVLESHRTKLMSSLAGCSTDHFAEHA